jgi:putative endonuclease
MPAHWSWQKMAAKLRAIKFSAMTEHVAAGLLRLKGCRILARQLRSPLGEIDIITRRGRTLVFIEVKARATRDQAIKAMNSHQRGRIERAALAYTADHPKFAGLSLLTTRFGGLAFS